MENAQNADEKKMMEEQQKQYDLHHSGRQKNRGSPSSSSYLPPKPKNDVSSGQFSHEDQNSQTRKGSWH